MPREVFELDKDERWQARLEEARARREVALREKAAGKPQKPRPKPWEIEGGGMDEPPEIEPVIQERGDDKFDFADRLEQLRSAEEAAPKTPGSAAASAPRTKHRTLADAEPTAPEPPESRMGAAGEPDEDPTTRAAVKRPRLRAKPGAPASPAAPSAPPPVPRRSRPAPSLILPGAPDVAELAERYAETLNPDPNLPEVPDDVAPAAPEDAAPAEPARRPEPTRRKRRAALALPMEKLRTRPGVRPLGMAWGLVALAALPLTTMAPPLETGPRMPVVAPFPMQPALGVTWSLYERPAETDASRWRAAPAPPPLALPEIDLPVQLLRRVQPLAAPAPAGEEPAPDWNLVAPPAQRPAGPEPLVPEAGVAPAGPSDSADRDAARRETEIAAIRPPGRAERVEATASAVPVPAAPQQGRAAAAGAPGSPLRVTILMPRLADRAMAEDLGADVARRGHDLVRIREVDYSISDRNVRYFHEDDRAGAAWLARAYGAELRDFTWFRPLPLEGTAELWLSGRGLSEPTVKRADGTVVSARAASGTTEYSSDAGSSAGSEASTEPTSGSEPSGGTSPEPEPEDGSSEQGGLVENVVGGTVSTVSGFLAGGN